MPGDSLRSSRHSQYHWKQWSITSPRLHQNLSEDSFAYVAEPINFSYEKVIFLFRKENLWFINKKGPYKKNRYLLFFFCCPKNKLYKHKGKKHDMYI